MNSIQSPDRWSRIVPRLILLLPSILRLLTVTVALLCSVAAEAADAQLDQLRDDLLNNRWSDADYELYLAPKSALKTTRPAFDTPAYFPLLSAESQKRIAHAVVLSPGSGITLVNGARRPLDPDNRDTRVELRGDKIVVEAGLLARLLGTPLPAQSSPRELVPVEQSALAWGFQVSRSRLGSLLISKAPFPDQAGADLDGDYELLYNCLYERPRSATLIADVAAHSKGRHPRLMLTPERIREISALIKTDTYARNCFAKVLATADRVLGEEVGKYEYNNLSQGIYATIKNPPGGRLMALGLAYHLTGEKKYAERAWREMEAVSRWPDWGCVYERQFLGTGNLSRGMGLGYDWFFDYLQPEQRRFLREAIIEKGVKPGLFYHHLRKANRFVLAKNNWCAVGNSGLVSLGLAIIDEEPALAGKLLEFSIGSLENVLSIYAEDGAYEEGPGYWAYGTGALVDALAMLETATGRTYGLSAAPGMDRTAYFTPHMIGPGGYFNFHDSAENAGTYVTGPEYFWFARHYKNPDFFWARMRLPEQEKQFGAKELLWFHGRPAGGFSLGLDYLGRGKANHVGTGSFRSSWTDPKAAFLGFHAGYVKVNHSQVDEGNFIFDAGGERWAIDIGYGSHDGPGGSSYFGGERLRYYRIRAEGHNVLLVNPDESAGQEYSESNRPQFSRYESTPDRAIAIADLACSYPKHTQSVRRGFQLDRRHNLAVIQDEARFLKPSSVYWFMHTRAHIELLPEENAALLSQNGQKLYVKLTGETQGAKFAVMPAKGLSPTVINMKGKDVDSIHKLALHFEQASELRIAVQLIPLKQGESRPSQNPRYTPLADWR